MSNGLHSTGHLWLIMAQVAVLPSAIALGVIVLLIYPAIVLRRYVRIMINIMEDSAPLPENGSHDRRITDGEEVSFRAVDGHQLMGVILRSTHPGPSRGMIIFAHEFGTDRASCLRYCSKLLAAGYDTFAFDFRGHGGSAAEEGYRPRQWPSEREQADVLGAIAFAGAWLEQQGRRRDLALFGISRGAGAAILAAVGIDCVRAIVTDGAYSSDTVLEYLMKRFATTFARIRIVAENHPPTFWRFFRWLVFRECSRRFRCRFPSVRKAVARLGDVPILFIHGEKDSYIPVAQSQTLYSLARGPKSLWIVPEASHNAAIRTHPDEYAGRVLAFLDRHLAPRAVSDRQAVVAPAVPSRPAAKAGAAPAVAGSWGQRAVEQAASDQ